MNMATYLWEKIEPIILEYRLKTGGEVIMWWTEELYYALREEQEKDQIEHVMRVELMEKRRKDRGSKRAMSAYGFIEKSTLHNLILTSHSQLSGES